MEHLRTIKKKEVIMQGLISCLKGIKQHEGSIWTAVARDGEEAGLKKALGVSECVSHVFIVCNSMQEAGGVVDELIADGLRAQVIAYPLEVLAYRLTLSYNDLAILTIE